MKDDLRKLEAGGVSSHDLYVKRELGCRENTLGQTFECVCV